MEIENKKTINEKELEILEFWDRDKTFEKSLKKNEKNDSYIFYDGPPFATGLPHHGHLLGSITKDLFGRFWTMKGRYVRRVWGWDCHGLPIENIAERELKINSKEEIEKIGIKEFNKFCRSKVLEYTEEWKKTIRRIARWVDMENCYKTMDNEYIESVWWAFKQLYEKGYIYEGEKILMYCPRCSTPLAKAEIAMDNSYKTIKEDSIVIRFKLKNKEGFALAWTTTPWTLPSNLALAVNPEKIYVYLKDKSDGNIYLLAKELINNFFKSEEEYEIIEEVKGRDLENLEYEPLFPYFKGTKNAFKIILGDFVTTVEGTGIVHIAPAFGEEDYEVCKNYNIKLVQPIDNKGNFTEEVKDFVGKNVLEVNQEIIDFLKKEGKIISVRKISHEYPFCYRCNTKLIYRAIPSLFVNIQKIKPKLFELNEKLNWHPSFLKHGRVKYSIETAPDWNISRNRYWATAIPIWKSEDGDVLVIGSIEELRNYAKNLPKDKEIDLHKDFLDDIILVKNGKEYRRVPEVLDCWFESGSMTFAQFHYPFENKEFFEKNFPADFVAEYIGQVRAWFYYMLVLSAILFNDVPFKNVVTTGTILAEDGEKMSKSKNNFTDPSILIEKFGADSLRFYLMSNQVMNAENLNFSDKNVEDLYKKVVLMIYNILNFYSPYKKYKQSDIGKITNLMERWIISKTNKLIKDVEKHLENYDTISASLEIKNFIENLSNWYIRRTRDRFNEGDEEAISTLRYVLENFAKVIAPLMPFSAEAIQKVLGKDISVHLEDWPSYEASLINEDIEKKMEEIREIASEVLKQRDTNKIALKQPLGLLSLEGFQIEKDFLEILKEEVNVKEIILKDSKEKKIFLDTKITPELEAEGFAREISRKVQALRKEAGLVKENLIELVVVVNERLKNLLENQKEFIKKRTNSKDFVLTTKKPSKEFQKSTKDKIKEFEIEIFFNKII